MSSSTYSNTLKSFRIFFRDYLKKPNLIASFKFPRRQYKPKIVPSKKELLQFFNAIDTLKERALFLLFTSSGLRRREVLDLEIKDLDFKNRMVKPKPHNSRTKRVWVSFFNKETAEMLVQYLISRKDNNPRLFPMARVQERKLWRLAREKTGLVITPQRLRLWFCARLGELGVADRYVDAFCGRVPSSILAKHYTDYNPKKLKIIYDNACLQMLN